MAVNWNLLETPNVGNALLQGYRAARSDNMDRADFDARMEDRQYTREQNALRGQQEQDAATRERQAQANQQVARLARTIAGSTQDPEKRRRRAVDLTRQLVANMSPEDQQAALAAVESFDWSDQGVSAYADAILGPRQTQYQNVSGVGLVGIPEGGEPTVAMPAGTPPSQRYIRGQDNNLYDTQTNQWITGPAPRARPSAGRSGGGGGRRGGGAPGGGGRGAAPGRDLGTGDRPNW